MINFISFVIMFEVLLLILISLLLLSVFLHFISCFIIIEAVKIHQIISLIRVYPFLDILWMLAFEMDLLLPFLSQLIIINHLRQPTLPNQSGWIDFSLRFWWDEANKPYQFTFSVKPSINGIQFYSILIIQR